MGNVCSFDFSLYKCDILALCFRTLRILKHLVHSKMKSCFFGVSKEWEDVVIWAKQISGTGLVIILLNDRQFLRGQVANLFFCVL